MSTAKNLNIDLDTFKTKQGTDSENKVVSVNITKAQNAFIKAKGINLSALVRSIIEQVRYETLNDTEDL